MLPFGYPPDMHFGGGALLGVLAIKVHASAKTIFAAEKKRRKNKKLKSIVNSLGIPRIYFLE